jgi:DnaJ family protein C protein 11
MKRELLELRESNQEILSQNKKEALEAQELMKETLERKIEAEREGLIIVSALYGKLPRVSATSPQVLDEQVPYAEVSIVLQTMVADSKLNIAAGHSKSSLVGFFDPCLGEEKKLRVSYRFKGRLHEVEVGDEDSVILPLRSHRE